jgi:G:T-mismatch repair DNA endonuclease (very short patch repair protein)
MKDRNKKGQFINGSKHPRKKIEFNLDLIKKEYLSGKSTFDLSKEFNTTQKTIYNRLKEIGVKLRKSLTEEQRKKISDTCKRKGIHPLQRYSRKAWNKGLKGNKYLNHYKDNKVWNTNKVGLQISNKKGKSYEELYGIENSNKYKEKIKEVRSKQIFPIKDSSIEVKIQDFLIKLGIKFMKHRIMNEIKHNYQCDIYIPIQEGIDRQTIIECFGDYWHRYPYGREIDKIRCKELREKGYRVLVFWENEIKAMHINDLKNKLFY